MSPDSAKPDSKADADSSSPVSGVSEFLGRVLDQLSIAAWMPAVMLVVNLVVLLVLHSSTSLDVGGAIITLTGSTLGVLVAVLFAVIVAAIVTQAFEFEIIRILEGYSTSLRGPIQALLRWRIRRQTRRRDRIETRYKAEQYACFSRVRANLITNPKPGISAALLDAVERIVLQAKQPAGMDPDLLSDARVFDWSVYLSSDTQYRLEALDARLASYPPAHRILPTRLGNVLRAAEHQLTLSAGENLEGYVLRHHDDIPDKLRNQHHDYRSRLEMYTSLTLVFVVLAAAGGALLAFASWWVPVAVAAGYLTLAWVAYRAAVASARGYGLVLVEIDNKVRAAAEATATTPGSS